MPFLSLGLLKDEREEVARENAGSPDDSGSPRNNLVINHPATSGDGSVGSRALASFDPVPEELSREGARPAQELSDKNVRPTQDRDSQLPAAIEELRLKVSGTELPKATVWGEKKSASPTEYLTVADRKGVPTFGTFKHGYLPSR